jgi:membrane protein insertase Oxa1/YidC/SpoIIIJ
MPLVQAPIFISFFFGIRKMAELPVGSMKAGGALWFTDLTIPDPLYILPVTLGLSSSSRLPVLSCAPPCRSSPTQVAAAF